MTSNWEEILRDRLQLYGHRNWLVIADSAYPAQTRQGMETIVADEEQTTVLSRALAILGGCRHIKPTIYTDKELHFVPEQDAPGITVVPTTAREPFRWATSAPASARGHHLQA